MTLAHVGVHVVEHRAGEVAESQEVVALRGIYWNLAGLEGIAIQVLYDSLLSSELLECRTAVQSSLSQVRIPQERMNASSNSV
jgi:hypothetical protein